MSEDELSVSVELEVEPTEGAVPAPDKPKDERVTEHEDDDPDADDAVDDGLEGDD